MSSEDNEACKAAKHVSKRFSSRERKHTVMLKWGFAVKHHCFIFFPCHLKTLTLTSEHKTGRRKKKKLHGCTCKLDTVPGEHPSSHAYQELQQDLNKPREKRIELDTWSKTYPIITQ